MHIRRFVGALAVLTAVVYVRFDARPAQACEAYNNMKHTRNTYHVVLSTDRDYTVVKNAKGSISSSSKEKHLHSGG